MGIIDWIYKIFKKEEKRNYPKDFAFIVFSDQSSRTGVTDDSQKLIIRYSVNKYGNYSKKKMRYSEERVNNFKNILKIPIHDKTKNQKFTVSSDINPGEASFLISR